MGLSWCISHGSVTWMLLAEKGGTILVSYVDICQFSAMYKCGFGVK